MAWKDTLQEGQEIVLVTSSKNGEPNANIVISKGFVDDKLLINDCQMSQTIKNIKENPLVCIIGKKEGEYYRIKGKASVYSSGKYFKISLERESSHKVKNSIVVEIKEVFDLDKVKKVL